MQKITILITALLLLTGCVSKLNIEQGNIIDQENYHTLRLGMSKEEVRRIMGTPVLINTFRDNQVDYVYTYKPGYGKGVEKNFVLVFQGDRLRQMGRITEQEFGH